MICRTPVVLYDHEHRRLSPGFDRPAVDRPAARRDRRRRHHPVERDRERRGPFASLEELLERVPLSVPTVEALGSGGGTKRLVIEEGPMADWLWRNLKGDVEQMVVCDPRRNRLVEAIMGKRLRMALRMNPSSAELVTR